MYKLYLANLKHFDPFILPEAALPEYEERLVDLGLDFYHRCYDESIEERYKEQSAGDEAIILNDYSSFSLHDFTPDAFYAPKLALEKFKLKRSFKDFNIAVYKGFGGGEASQSLVKLCEAKEIKFEREFKDNGYRLLHIDEDAALKAAAAIVFDAYDSGADFLLVEDVYSFLAFDNKALQKAMNRSLNDFYILSFAQMYTLAVGLMPKSLANNKLKAVLV